MSLRRQPRIRIAKASWSADDDTLSPHCSLASLERALGQGPRAAPDRPRTCRTPARLETEETTGARRRQKCRKTGKPCCAKSPRSWPAPTSPWYADHMARRMFQVERVGGWTTASSTG